MLYSVMYKLSYCWKCEEIKETHKVLNAKLPEGLVETLGDYEKCKSCEASIKHNERILEKWNKNEDHYRARQVIKSLLIQFIDEYINQPTFTTRDYKNIIKRTQHPLKNEMLTFLRTPSFGWYGRPAHFLNMLLDGCWYKTDFINLSNVSAGEDREIIKMILLELFDYLRTNKKRKYNITEQELNDYLEERMIY